MEPAERRGGAGTSCMSVEASEGVRSSERSRERSREPEFFVDSNILIYAYDRSAGFKHELARSVVRGLWERRSGTLSVQVLQEFFVSATRKIPAPLDVREAAEVIRDLSRWRVHRPGASDVLEAVDLHRRVGISFWDAMIVRSAVSQGCGVLYSEDLNDGQIYDGVRVSNPVRGDGA